MAEIRPLPRTFGDYLLTRSLGRDPLGETFRAGTSSGPGLAPFVLVRVFDGEGIDRAALVPAMETAVELLDEFRGQAAAKGTVLGIVDDVPYTGIDYVPGMTLDKILAQTPAGVAPFEPENALYLGDRLLAGLDAGKSFTLATGAPHGFLVPAFVTVSGDGEARIFGAGLGRGLLPSLAGEAARKAFGPYVAPEVAASGRPTPAGDAYSVAAIVIAAATGKPPESGRGLQALTSASAEVLPAPARELLARMMDPDPTRRETDPATIRRNLAKAIHGLKQASSFTLAFALSQRFGRALDDDRRTLSDESRLDARAVAAAEERAAARRAAPPVGPSVPQFGVDAPPPAEASSGASKKGFPLPAIGAIVAVLVGGGALVMKMATRTAPPPPPTPAPVVTPTAAPAPTPIVVGKDDPAFQEALQQQLALEMKKVQDQIAREQKTASKKQQAELDLAAEEAKKAAAADEAAKAARDRADQDEAARQAKVAAEARLREEVRRKAAAEAAAAEAKPVQAGDLVEVTQVEKPPSAIRVVKPEPTLLARQRKISGTVLARVLVNENGGVDQVEIMRDTTPPVGLADTTREALKRWVWSPATKDGKPVKTWVAVPVPFALK